MPRFLRDPSVTTRVPPPNLFRCTWRSTSTADWATFSGELDTSNAPSLEQMLRDAEAHARLIVLDLRELEFIDCTGARVILESSERMRRARRAMVVVRGPSAVDKLFRLTRIDERLKILDLKPAEPAVQVLLKLATTPSAPLAYPARIRGCRQWKPL